MPFPLTYYHHHQNSIYSHFPTPWKFSWTFFPIPLLQVALEHISIRLLPLCLAKLLILESTTMPSLINLMVASQSQSAMSTAAFDRVEHFLLLKAYSQLGLQDVIQY